MKDFLKYTLASALGFVLANIVLSIFALIIVLISVGSIMSAAEDFQQTDKVTVEDESILKVELDYPLSERAQKDNPFNRFFSEFSDQPPQVSYRKALESIDKARTDERIEGILLETSGVPNSFAKLEEVREKLSRFRDSGKFVYSYSNILTQKGLYLASTADSVFMQAEGLINFNGLVSQTTFFKGLLDDLGVEPYVFKIGRYKSAPEFLTRKSLSESSKEQTRKLLANKQDQFLTGISNGRDIPVEKLQTYIDDLNIRTAEDAVEVGLADERLYQDELNKYLRNQIGLSADDEVESIKLSEYQQTLSKDESDADEKVAVVYANGGIGLGEGDENSVGASSMTEALEKARTDSSVKSIVLRVNSPGGGALASDIIWREVSLAAEEKPLIVSMGDVAASGGYYIASPATTIMAQENTVTGSIGIFAILIDWKQFWNEEVGVTFDRVKTGEYADLGNPNRPLSEEEKAVFRQFIEESYQDFVDRVAEGRDLSEAAVDSVARGRVWTGEDAKQANLVDKIGSFNEAIALAADKADLEDYQLVRYPEREGRFEAFFNQSTRALMRQVFGSYAQQQIQQYERLRFIQQQGNGAYMMLPFNTEVQ